MRKLLPICLCILSYLSSNAQYEIEVNNIRATNEQNGLLFNTTTGFTGGFEAPIDSNLHTFYAFNLWVSGLNSNSSPRAYGTKFLQSTDDTFRYGPMMDSIYYETENDIWDRVWNISRIEIEDHVANFADIGYVMPEVIEKWPAHGDVSKGQAANLAPFIDVDGNGIYNPSLGDYPSVLGDQAIYSIYNGERYNENMTPMGIETHVMTYAFDCDEQLDNVIFLYAKHYNRSNTSYSDSYLGYYADLDIGFYGNDSILTDVDRASVIGLNYHAWDEDYGIHLPAQSVTILRGPKQDIDNIDNDFGIFENQTTNGIGYGDGIVDNEYRGLDFTLDISNGNYPTNDPENELEIYYNMTGKWREGSFIKYGGNGYDTDTSSINSRYKNSVNDAYQYGTYGLEPFENSGWVSIPSDKRMIGSSGPFTFEAGTTKDMYMAFVFAREGIGSDTSMILIRENIDALKILFEEDNLDCGSMVLGVENVYSDSKLDLAVYPNPFENSIHFNYLGEDSDAKIFVYDLLGHELLNSSVTHGENTIDLSVFKGNTYILRLKDKTGSYSQKVIKK